MAALAALSVVRVISTQQVSQGVVVVALLAAHRALLPAMAAVTGVVEVLLAVAAPLGGLVAAVQGAILAPAVTA